MGIIFFANKNWVVSEYSTGKLATVTKQPTKNRAKRVVLVKCGRMGKKELLNRINSFNTINK